MEKINVNGVLYDTTNVTTSLNSISFSTSDKSLEEMKTTFASVSSLTVQDEDGNEYGVYENLVFESVTEFADGTVMVTMHIMTKEEQQIQQLQISQEEQDEAIAELYGMEV